MLYHYLAANKDGKFVEADFDADNLSQVLQHLASQNLRPINVKPLKTNQGLVGRFLGRVTLVDKIFLAKYLSLMLRVGTDLLSAINILIADFDKPAVKNLLLEIRDNLSHGRPFYLAFEAHPREFSSVFINLIKAAESSGNLQQTFDQMSTSLEKEAELRSRVRATLVYPIILLVIALGVFLFLTTFALPKIANVFKDSGINPPVFSRVVFSVGLFVNEHIVVFLLILLVIFGPGLYFIIKNPVGRRMFGRFLTRLPLIRTIYRELAVQRFASTFSSLMKAGLPIIQTTTITAEVVGSEEFRVSLLRIANEGLSQGLTIGEAFRREPVFPRVVANLMAISEKAGHLEEVLDTLADFYAANIDANIRTLVAFLEPALLILMGIMVASIALAIIVPIYQLTAQF